MTLLTIRGLYSESDVLAAERLLRLVAPDDESRERLLQRLHRELDEPGDQEYFAELPIIWILAPFVGFYVDWKDDESFKGFVQALAHAWGASAFSFPDDLRSETDEMLTVPELMHWACHRRAPHGLLLWHWNTDEDNYCGALSNESQWPEIQQVCESLGVAVASGDVQFDKVV